MVVRNVLPTDMGVPLSSSTYCFIIKTFKHCKDTDFFLFLQEIRYFFRFAQEVPSLYLRTKLAVTPIAKRSFTDFAPTLVRRKNGIITRVMRPWISSSMFRTHSFKKDYPQSPDSAPKGQKLIA